MRGFPQMQTAASRLWKQHVILSVLDGKKRGFKKPLLKISCANQAQQPKLKSWDTGNQKRYTKITRISLGLRTTMKNVALPVQTKPKII